MENRELLNRLVQIDDEEFSKISRKSETVEEFISNVDQHVTRSVEQKRRDFHSQAIRRCERCSSREKLRGQVMLSVVIAVRLQMCFYPTTSAMNTTRTTI